jgi:hypothetical protein
MWHLRLIGPQIRLGWQIWLRRQFIGNSAPSAAPLAVWYCRRLCLQIWIRRQVRLRRQFIGNLAPPAAPSAALSANLDPSVIRLHRQFGSVGGSICKFGSVSKFGSVAYSSAIQPRRQLRLQIWICIHWQFGCIGNSAASAIRLHRLSLANSDPSALHGEFGCIGNSAASANSSANNWLRRQLRRQIIGSIGKLGFCGSPVGKWRTHARTTITNNNKPNDDG